MQIKVNDKLYPAEKVYGVVRFKGNPLLKHVALEYSGREFPFEPTADELLEYYAMIGGYSVDALLDNPRFESFKIEVVE